MRQVVWAILSAALMAWICHAQAMAVPPAITVDSAPSHPGLVTGPNAHYGRMCLVGGRKEACPMPADLKPCLAGAQRCAMPSQPGARMTPV
jgi:hypothetical protein